QLRDANGNAVSQAGTRVTAVIATGPTGATLTNATATTTGSGAATFNGLAISGSVGGYTLRFESGTLSAPTSGTITLSAGTAATTWPLGRAGGADTARATASGLAGSPVICTATATAGTAATIAANSPTSQSAAAGTAVSTPPSVIVKDANGNPVAQVAVTFAVAPGNGTITGGSQTTNGSGVATVGSWTLSATAGPNTLTATSGSLSGSPVTFTATGTAGPSATMAKSSGDNLTGQVATRLQTPHVVLVSDVNGNPVAGVAVAWAAGSGGGSVDPATSTTDGNGHAQTFRTLGILIGTQT